MCTAEEVVGAAALETLQHASMGAQAPQPRTACLQSQTVMPPTSVPASATVRIHASHKGRASTFQRPIAARLQDGKFSLLVSIFLDLYIMIAPMILVENRCHENEIMLESEP